MLLDRSVLACPCNCFFLPRLHEDIRAFSAQARRAWLADYSVLDSGNDRILMQRKGEQT